MRNECMFMALQTRAHAMTMCSIVNCSYPDPHSPLALFVTWLSWMKLGQEDMVYIKFRDHECDPGKPYEDALLVVAPKDGCHGKECALGVGALYHMYEHDGPPYCLSAKAASTTYIFEGSRGVGVGGGVPHGAGCDADALPLEFANCHLHHKLVPLQVECCKIMYCKLLVNVYFLESRQIKAATDNQRTLEAG
jgi:hypothetical protein